MVLDIEPDELAKELGHDGMKVVRPNESSNLKYRGIHPQELLDVAYLKHGKSFRLVEMDPCIGTQEVNEEAVTDHLVRFNRLVKDCEGILIGCDEKGSPHAVAFNSIIHDPRGYSYSFFDPLHQFAIDMAYVMCKT